MASQDPSTAYTAAPEKKSSWFPSFTMPKLPDFFGTAAPAPAPAAAVAEQSSMQTTAGRRRKTKKAGRRRTHKKVGGRHHGKKHSRR